MSIVETQLHSELYRAMNKDLEQGLASYLATHSMGEGLESCLIDFIQKGQALLKEIPDDLITESMCLAAVEMDLQMMQYIPQRFRTEPVHLAMLSRLDRERIPYYFSLILDTDRTEALCIAGVSRHGIALRYVPELLITQVMCEIAVRNEGLAISHVPKAFLTQSMYNDAVNTAQHVIRFVPRKFRTQAMLERAAEGYANTLAFAPKNLITQSMCENCVALNASALRDVPKHFITLDMCIRAVENDHFLIECVPAEFHKNQILLEHYFIDKSHKRPCIGDLDKSVFEINKHDPESDLERIEQVLRLSPPIEKELDYRRLVKCFTKFLMIKRGMSLDQMDSCETIIELMDDLGVQDTRAHKQLVKTKEKVLSRCRSADNLPNQSVKHVTVDRCSL